MHGPMRVTLPIKESRQDPPSFKERRVGRVQRIPLAEPTKREMSYSSPASQPQRTEIQVINVGTSCVGACWHRVCFSLACMISIL